MAKGENCPQHWASMIVAGSFVLGHQRIHGELLNQYDGKGHGYYRAILHFLTKEWRLLVSLGHPAPEAAHGCH